MNIVCENCGANYQIPEDRAQEPVIKFICNNCGHPIEVDNSGGQHQEAIWYISWGGDNDQIGPIAVDQIAQHLAAGQFTEDAFVWREGLSNWQRLGDVDELQYLLAPTGQAQSSQPSYQDASYQIPDSHFEDEGDLDQDATIISPSHTAAAINYGAASDPSYNDSDTFNPYYNQDSPSDASDAVAPSQSQSYSSPTSDQPSGTFADFSTQSSPVDDGDSAGSMFALFDSNSNSNSSASNESGLQDQRNENSVLFSLSSLPQTSHDASSSQSPSVTEGSGLIDLQALASAHDALGSGESEADPFAQNTMALPPLTAMGSHKSNTPLIAGAIAGGVLLLGLVGLVVYLLTQKEPPPAPVAQQPVQEKVIIKEIIREPENTKEATDAAKAAEAAKAAAKINEEKLEEEQAEEEEAVDEKADTKNTARTRRPSRGSSRTRNDTKEDKPAPRRRARRSNNKKSDGIDALLNKMDKKDSKAAKPKSSGGLTKAQVGGTIRRYVPRVVSCGKMNNKGNLHGKLLMKFEIRPNGSVTSVSVSNAPFKGSDVGRCAEGVVRRMRFPSSSASANLPITYPFKI